MELNKIGFLINEGLYYPAILAETSKSNTPLQPLFEAFTNALEAIAQKKSDATQNEITVKVYYDTDLFDTKVMSKILIEDSGIGFNDEEFRRFLTFKDTRKGYHNRGSGRLQLIHSFGIVEYISTYQEAGHFKERKFHLSSSPAFLKENAIAHLDSYGISGDVFPHTSLTLSNLLSEKDQIFYNMTLANYKEVIIDRYIQYFCAQRDTLPKIIFESYKGVDLDEKLFITADDIPSVDSSETFAINYLSSRIEANSGKDDFETFTIEAFKISKEKLPKNIMTLTSKGEIVEDKNFKLALSNLAAEDHLDNKRFLFLISSPYINERDSDIRGQLKIPWRKDQSTIFDQNIIFMDDIEQMSNETVSQMYNTKHKCFGSLGGHQLLCITNIKFNETRISL